MEPVFVRSAYNYDVDQASDEAGLDCSKDKGRVQQSFEDETNINVIVARVFKTNEFPQNVPMVFDGDFVDAPDFETSMQLIVKAREGFDAMPAKIRSRFDNDPSKFVKFVSDPANFDEAVSFGMIRPEVVEARAAAAKAKAEQDVEERVKARMAAEAAKGTGST